MQPDYLAFAVQNARAEFKPESPEEVARRIAEMNEAIYLAAIRNWFKRTEPSSQRTGS